MKILWILWLTLACVWAQEHEMTPSEHNTIHNSNNRPTIRLQKERKMHEMQHIDEAHAKAIAEKVCDSETVRSLRLTHQGMTLYWLAQTTSCRIKINALDGTIIEKEKR